MTPIKFCFLSLLLIVTGFPATAEVLMSRVVGVHDGDMLTLRVERHVDLETVRLKLRRKPGPFSSSESNHPGASRHPAFDKLRQLLTKEGNKPTAASS